MLRVVQSTSAGQARHYYTEGLEHGDYFLGAAELVGRWGGKGAELLGLRGNVDRGSFHRLCDNQKPDGSGQLTARTKANRRVGYDMNFHAPKGVSVVHALTGDQRILEAVVDAASAAMQRIESEAKTRVRLKDANSDRVTGNLVWVAFPHLTTRPINGVPDPHLHVHCYVFNATYDATEQRWKAGEFGDLKRNAPFFEAHFHAALMKRVSDLGYPVREEAKRWDIANLPPGLVEKFSRRTAEIEALAEAKGIKDIEAKAALGAKTRRSKNASRPFTEVQADWKDRLSGEERDSLAALRRSGLTSPQPSAHPTEERPGILERYSAKKAVDRALEHCFERLSVATERQVLAAALRFGGGRVDEATLQSELAGRELLRKDTKLDTLLSLPAVLAEEKRLLEFARTGRSRCEPAASAMKSQLPSDLDRRLVEHVLTSRDRVTLLRMPASADRAAVMRESLSALREQGIKVTVVATGASTRDGLRQDNVDAIFVQKLLGDPDTQRRLRGHTLWVEGANLLGAKDAARLFDIAEQQRCRIVLSGDTRRPSAVGRGDVTRLLGRLAGLESPQATRTPGSSRNLAKEIRNLVATGDLAGAVRCLGRLGHIEEVGAGRDFPALTRAYVAATKAKERCVVVATDKAEATKITECVRTALRGQGLLKKKSVTFQALESVHGTVAERGLAQFYKAGQVVQFSKHAKGFKAGERYTIVGHDPFGNVLARKGLFVEALPLSRADRFETFAPRNLELSPGDVVRVTKSGSAKSRPLFPGILGRPWHHRLEAGALHHVKSVSRDGIRLSNGIIVPLAFGHLAHGYCMTPHGVAGRQVDRVLLVTQPPGQGNPNERLQVAAAAAHKHLHLFTDDPKALLGSLGPSRERMLASDLADKRSQSNPFLERQLGTAKDLTK